MRKAADGAMRRRPSVFLLSVFCLLLTGLHSEIIDRIAISAGNQVITESQIEDEVRVSAFLNLAKVDLSPAEKKKAAEQLVEQALIRREVDFSHYPLPGESDADASLKAVKARYPSVAQYDAALGEYGITEQQLRERLLWQITLLRFIDYRFRPGIQISDTDVQTYYQKQVEEWRKQAAQIPSIDDARPQIEEILTQQRIDANLDRWLADTRTRIVIRYHDESLQ